MRQRELVTGCELYQARRLSHISNYADTCLQASAGQRWPLLDWPSTYLQHTTYRAFSDLHTTVIVLLDVSANLDFRVSSVIQQKLVRLYRDSHVPSDIEPHIRQTVTLAPVRFSG